MLTEVSRISEVIITPEYNQEGIYTVRFCIQVRLFICTVTCCFLREFVSFANPNLNLA